MSRIENAISDVITMDELAEGDSFVHRLFTPFKFIVTIAYIVLIMSIDSLDYGRLIPFVLYPVVMLTLSKQSVVLCIKKMRLLLPLLILVGIFNPIINTNPYLYLGSIVISEGMITFITLLIKGICALMATFILISTTGIDRLCKALRSMHFPHYFVVLIMITYRYISLLLREGSTMMNAYSMRAPGQRGIHISAWGSFLGQLLLRSMDRADNLYQSMELRGLNDNFFLIGKEKSKLKDYVYLIIVMAMFAVFRVLNISLLIGSLFVR